MGLCRAYRKKHFSDRKGGNGKNDFPQDSGGEKQKIIIARCLYKCSDIMVFDEAFSEISSNDRINIINKINDVYRDKTIIYVNHFNDYIKYDQILEIKGTRKDKVDE